VRRFIGKCRGLSVLWRNHKACRNGQYVYGSFQNWVRRHIGYRQTGQDLSDSFPLISGLIVYLNEGGMLSHGAIVSRSFGIPAIVGVENATLK
jgi:hypothetical protein